MWVFSVQRPAETEAVLIWTPVDWFHMDRDLGPMNLSTHVYCTDMGAVVHEMTWFISLCVRACQVLLWTYGFLLYVIWLPDVMSFVTVLGLIVFIL
jgi:hypothetical protein